MKIDGSYGEGGGQILRTAIALSMVTGIPIEINNIRKTRPKSGLKAQHMKAIDTAASICEAEFDGCYLHSTYLSFKPGKIKGGTYEVDIGTAGSIPLLLQCIMPVAICTDKSIKIKMKGGTDVLWSPSIDYLRFVALNAFSQMGYSCDIKLIKRGYYPIGGGYIEAIINPSILKKINFEDNKCENIEGISHSSRLPAHVAERQSKAAENILHYEGYNTRISLEIKDCPSTGSGITLWCGTIGAVALGKRSLKAEKVGSNAAESILPELKSGAGVDIYLADQLIPYLALAGGGSFTTRNITSHARTNIWVTEQFLDTRFKIEELKTGLFRVYLE